MYNQVPTSVAAGLGGGGGAAVSAGLGPMTAVYVVLGLFALASLSVLLYRAGASARA